MSSSSRRQSKLSEITGSKTSWSEVIRSWRCSWQRRWYEKMKGERQSPFCIHRFNRSSSASSLLRQPYEEFEEFVNSHTGSTYLVFRPGFWHSVVSGNAEVHECLKFILAIGDQARDSRKYDSVAKANV